MNDQLRDYWGKAPIRQWAERDIIGIRLTTAVTIVVEHYGNFIVTANVDGNFDKRGLPDPLVHSFYFTLVAARSCNLSSCVIDPTFEDTNRPEHLEQHATLNSPAHAVHVNVIGVTNVDGE